MSAIRLTVLRAGALLFVGMVGASALPVEASAASLPTASASEPTPAVDPMAAPAPAPVAGEVVADPLAAGLPGGPATPVKAEAPALVPPAPDKLTLEDVRDKLVVTRDETWVLRDQLLSMDLTKQFYAQQAALGGIQK